jgi:hypothetical protein
MYMFYYLVMREWNFLNKKEMYRFFQFFANFIQI